MSELHVIFGSGPVGLTVADELVAKGKSVTVVNRSGRAAVPDGVKVVQGDATNLENTRAICRGAAVVYNCTNAPYDKWAEILPPLQVGILEGAISARAKLVVMDNLYMYGPTDGKPLVETLPYAAITRKGQIRAALADNFMQAHTDGKVQVTIARASDFFGPRVLNSAMGERVFYPALKGKPVQIIGNPDMPHTYSYMRDVAKGLVILGEQEEAFGQVWHLPSPESVTSREFIKRLGEEIGHEIKIQVLPKWMIKVLGWVNPIIGEVYEMLYEFEEPFVVDHQKFELTFGNHTTPLQPAIHDTLEWFRTHPQS